MKKHLKPSASVLYNQSQQITSRNVISMISRLKAEDAPKVVCRNILVGIFVVLEYASDQY